MAIWSVVTTNLTGKLRIKCLWWHTCGVCTSERMIRGENKTSAYVYERGRGALSLHRDTMTQTHTHISVSTLSPLLLGSRLFSTDLISVKVSAICQIPARLSVTLEWALRAKPPNCTAVNQIPSRLFRSNILFYKQLKTSHRITFIFCSHLSTKKCSTCSR